MIMKKLMMMAMAAAMMTMGGNATAADNSAPAPETMEAKSINAGIGKANAVRVMIHKNGETTNRFDYTIDNEGRVSSKTMYRFDNSSYKWIPVMKYTATYGTDGNTLGFASWDKESGSFTGHAAETSYSKSECPVLISLPECIDY